MVHFNCDALQKDVCSSIFYFRLRHFDVAKNLFNRTFFGVLSITFNGLLLLLLNVPILYFQNWKKTSIVFSSRYVYYKKIINDLFVLLKSIIIMS